jgi:hypothetical protein
MEMIIVSVVLTLAVGYAIWRFYKVLTSDNEACIGCPLAENCTKKKKNIRKILRCREK